MNVNKGKSSLDVCVCTCTRARACVCACAGVCGWVCVRACKCTNLSYQLVCSTISPAAIDKPPPNSFSFIIDDDNNYQQFAIAPLIDIWLQSLINVC